MKGLLALILFSLFLTSCQTLPQQNIQSQSINHQAINEIIKRTARLTCFENISTNPDGAKVSTSANGSGIHINNVLYTANHVSNECNDEIQGYFPNQKFSTLFRTTKENQAYDYAQLKAFSINHPNFSKIKSPFAHPKIGETVIVIGYPHAVEKPQAIQGKLIIKNNEIRIDANLSASVTLSGLSGGPVINAQGKIIGIFTASMEPLVSPFSNQIDHSRKLTHLFTPFPIFTK